MPTEPQLTFNRGEDSAAAQSSNEDPTVYCASPLSRVEEDRQVRESSWRVCQRGLPPRPPAVPGSSAPPASASQMGPAGAFLLRSGIFEATGQRKTHEDANCVRDSLEGVAVPGLRAFYAVRARRASYRLAALGPRDQALGSLPSRDSGIRSRAHPPSIPRCTTGTEGARPRTLRRAASSTMC